MNRPRTSSLGCLGCFSMLVLAFWTAVLVPALLWLNPSWLDRLAIWRPAPYPVEDVDALAADVAAPVKKPVDDRYRLLEGARASVDYVPARGATLEAPDGARIELPGGAIREPLQVSLTPAAHLPKAMQGAVCGPAYELRIGANEHYRFGAPVRVTLPYLPELVMKDTQPAVCVWEGDHWTPMRTTSDPKTRTVTAELPHASPVGVFSAPLPPVVYIPATIAAAAGAIGYVYSSTERGALWASTTFRDSRKLVTNSFAIHYFLFGEHKVPQDAEYPLSAGRPPQEHPLYVVDIARHLEDARSSLPQVGMEVSVPIMIRHDVFLHFDKAFGSSPPGGPIFIHPRMNEVAAAESVPCETALKGTIVHELIHVAQDKTFGGIPQRFRDRWWIEATAEYLAERWWMHRGVKIDLAETYYLRGEPRLPEKPIDTTGDPEYYAWAVLLHWLDRRSPESGFKFVQVVNASKSGTIESLDAAARATLGTGIADVLEAFARDFYHDDLWRGSTMPLLHRDTARNQALAQHCRDNDRAFVFTKVGAEENDWAVTHAPPIKRLAARAAIVQIDGVPPHLKGKLVVAVEGSPTPDLQIHLAASKVPGKLPAPGAPGGFHAFTVTPGMKSTRIIEGLGKDVNRVTLLFVNKSMTQDAPSFMIERWLLVPPATVSSKRETPGQPQWKVTWERVGLQSCPQAFKGYRVYRRRLGESDAAFVLVQSDVKDTFWIDTAPDVEDYLYTVKVKDLLGNESEAAPIEGEDPFQGEWTGEVALVRGEFAKPIVDALRKEAEESEKKSLASLASEKEPAERERRRRGIADEKKRALEWIATVEKFLTTAEEFARLGIPMKLEIQRTDGEYFLSIPELLWQKTDSKEKAKLVRLGRHTLGFAEQPKELAPLRLRLHREDEIREQEWVVRHTEKDKTYEFAFRWAFRRKT